MIDIKVVYQAIADTVTTAAIDVNGSTLTASPYGPDALVTPHLFGAEFAGQYHRTHGGQMHLQMTWRLMIARGDDRTAQQAAQRLASTTDGSLIAVIEAARGAPGQKALGGACDDLTFQRVTGPRMFQIGQVEFYGLEFTLFAMG